MSLGTTTRSLARNAKKQFPGASEADIRQLVHLQVEIALDNPANTTKDEDILKLADAAFDEAATAGETWAVNLKNSFRDNVVKPLVEEARAKGVDPVPIIVFKTDLAEDDVRNMIETLDADTSSADLDGADDDLYDGDGETEGDVTSFSTHAVASVA